MRFAERAAEHPEIVGVNEHRPIVYRAPAGYHPVAVRAFGLHAEAGRAMAPQRLDLLERALVEQ